MRLVIQRCKDATCEVNKQITGAITNGFVIYVGFGTDDTEADLDLMVKKTLGLRIFEDEAFKMNKNIFDVNGEILAISQFTLYANAKHGNRPSFTEAMEFNKAQGYYELFCDKLMASKIRVAKGIFGADMKISSLNDGPVTIILDSNQLK